MVFDPLKIKANVGETSASLPANNQEISIEEALNRLRTNDNFSSGTSIEEEWQGIVSGTPQAISSPVESPDAVPSSPVFNWDVRALANATAHVRGEYPGGPAEDPHSEIHVPSIADFRKKTGGVLKYPGLVVRKYRDLVVGLGKIIANYRRVLPHVNAGEAHVINGRIRQLEKALYQTKSYLKVAESEQKKLVQKHTEEPEKRLEEFQATIEERRRRLESA